MHTYQQRWPEDRTDWEPPSLDGRAFRSADDVAAFAEIDALTAWYTWSQVWHLDAEGFFCCCSGGSTGESVQRFAANPGALLECRWVETDMVCPDNWVILEPRHPWMRDRYHVTEDDARAFIELRRGLDELGIQLLDVVVFDQEFHWWSLHELTSGTTVWPAGRPNAPRAARPKAVPKRRRRL